MQVLPKTPQNCFKAYDIRGQVPSQLNPAIAYRIGLAYGERYGTLNVALGCDARHSSRPLLEALALGLNHAGSGVVDIGYCGTEEVYFAAQQPGIDGGIMVTASHNPANYNGMKLVRNGAVPISGDTGLRDLEDDVMRLNHKPTGVVRMQQVDIRTSYVQFLLDFVRDRPLKPLRVVVNAGNGTAGLLIDALAPHLPIELIRVHCTPDPDFPNGIPNPLLPDNRQQTTDAVRANEADFGVAWDGDFDRCFFFDEGGYFIEGYYIVGLLAEAMLSECAHAKIIHDPRLTWNTIEIINRHGGVAVESRTGHAFVKERMRAEDALYGGEMSAHHYFRAFAYCDNGTLPWLLVAALLTKKQAKMSDLVNEAKRRFPISGEINRQVADTQHTMRQIELLYGPQARHTKHVDGLSVEFAKWRFNLRPSNTEPLLRLNVEARDDVALMRERTRELLSEIDQSNVAPCR